MLQHGPHLIQPYAGEPFEDHLEDAFMVRTVAMESASERQRMVNPRKTYPVDHGLIPLYARTGREHRGRTLETVVLLELERRGYSVSWVRTPDGWEVDFFAQRSGESPLLVQVCVDSRADSTWDREVRALVDAAVVYPDATPLLVTLEQTPPSRNIPSPLEWRSATQWLLEKGLTV